MEDSKGLQVPSNYIFKGIKKLMKKLEAIIANKCCHISIFGLMFCVTPTLPGCGANIG